MSEVMWRHVSVKVRRTRYTGSSRQIMKSHCIVADMIILFICRDRKVVFTTVEEEHITLRTRLPGIFHKGAQRKMELLNASHCSSASIVEK